MFDAMKSLFGKKEREPVPELSYPGFRVRYQILWADYGIGKVISTWETKQGAIDAITSLTESGMSYAIREVLVKT